MKYLFLLLFLMGCARPDMQSRPSCGGTIGGWRNIPVHIHTNMGNEWQAALAAAINDWNTANKKELFVMADDGVSIFFGTPREPNEEAYTSGTVDGDGYISSSFISVNQSIDVDKESLLIHEMGHVLGLKHSDEGNTETMSPYLWYGQIRRYIDQWAQDRISCSY